MLRTSCITKVTGDAFMETPLYNEKKFISAIHYDDENKLKLIILRSHIENCSSVLSVQAQVCVYVIQTKSEERKKSNILLLS